MHHPSLRGSQDHGNQYMTELEIYLARTEFLEFGPSAIGNHLNIEGGRCSNNLIKLSALNLSLHVTWRGFGLRQHWRRFTEIILPKSLRSG